MADEKRPPSDTPESAIDRLKRAADAAPNFLRQPAAAPAADTGGLFGRGGTLGLGLGDDPWQTTMERTVNPFIKNTFGDRTESVSKWVLPQNAPELAVQALTLGSPLGRLFGKGVVAGAKGLPGVIGRGVLKGAESGAAAGLTAKATGHDVGTSAMSGTIGGALGQAAGEGVGALAQTAASSKMVTKATENVANGLRTLLGDVRVPGGTDPTKILRSMINGEVTSDLGQEIADLGASYATKKVPGMQGTLKTLWQDASLRPQLVKHLTPADRKAYQALGTELQRTQLVQDWLTGGLTPEKARKVLTDETGNLTTEGLAKLQSRFGDFQRGLERAFGPDKAKELAEGIYQDLAKGTKVGVAGEAPKLTVSIIPKVHLGVEGGRLPWQPGWEKVAGTTAAKLAPGAARAVGATAPMKYLGTDVPGTAAPPPGEAPPVRPEPAYLERFKPTLPPPSTPLPQPMTVSPERSSEPSGPDRWFVPAPPERPPEPAGAPPAGPAGFKDAEG